ncbi:MAG TPA: hypothetical protein VFZ38_12210 [Vicinamibacterales bacterium]|jgi:hypothetical protein
MTFDQRKLLVLSLWVASALIIGIIVTIDKPDLWLLVATVAVAPALFGSWLWNAPPPTLSEIIARHRR